MPSPGSESPDDCVFNDAPQQTETNHNGSQDTLNDASAKPKRIACVLCRKRKLKCDGTRPSCGTCNRLSHHCEYDEVRKKSGPKRGYVKLLEQRLQQVETLLRTQDANEQSKDTARQDSASAYVANTVQQPLPNSNDFLNVVDAGNGMFRDARTPGSDSFGNNGRIDMNGNTEHSWEIIGLGLEEPLPPQDVMEDLYQIYFRKIHSSIPLIHRPRFMAALNLAPHMRPPVCLRYIMWTLAASVTDKYCGLQEHFYRRARKYAQMDELKGHGESTITLAHCQAWALMCTYEFKQMYFPRAWLSAGRAVRLAQMMQLHRLDGVGLDVKQCLPPPKDWTEREERRRTFWLCFCIDRYASIGTGWPMTIDERDIMTNLPASEDAFEKSKPMPTSTLEQVLKPNGTSNLQSFGAVVLTCAMFGRNLLHLHRPEPDDNEDDINGGFWTRHRKIEQILLQTSLGLPDHLRLPSNLNDPNVTFANMCLHTSAICLHQAAIFKADKFRLPVSVGNESKIRCVTAAAEIASIMRMISHMDLCAMNPFLSFCVYVASRVFVQYLKTRPNDQQMISSLQFLLQAMQALRRKNPLTESFLAQLDLDLESAGLTSLRDKSYKLVDKMATVQPINSDGVGCSPIFEIRDSQNPHASMNLYNNAANPRKSPSQFTTSPGPPFHVADVNNVSMSTQDSNYAPSKFGGSNTMSRPQPTVLQHYPPTSFNFGQDNEMDLSGDRSADQPSPSTIHSRSNGGRSTSQSSHSPAQPIEHHLPYRASPKISLSEMHVNSNNNPPIGTAAVFPSFSVPNADLFTDTFNPGTGGMNDDVFNQSFMVGQDWDFTAMAAGGGMQGMSEGAWNQMLDSVTMGWESLGPPHGAPNGRTQGAT